MEDCHLRSCADCEGGGARHSEKGRTEERGAGVDRGGQTWQISKSFTTDFDPTCPLQVKAAWLADLEELIERISAKFSAHFASMGFAGQVNVKRFVGSDKSSLHAHCPCTGVYFVPNYLGHVGVPKTKSSIKRNVIFWAKLG